MVAASTSMGARPDHWAAPGTPAVARQLRRYVVGFGVAGIALPTCLVLMRPPTLTLEQAALAAMVIVLGLAPAFLYLRDGARSPLPLLPLNGLFYATGFGFTPFYPELDWQFVPSDAVTHALTLTVVGLLVLYGSYAVSGALMFGRLRPVRLKVEFSALRLRILAWLFFAAHLVYQFIPSLQELPSVGHFLYPLGWLAIGILYIQHLRRELPLLHRLAFFGLALPAEMLSRWVSGAVYQVVIVFVFVMLIYWQVRRRVPWATLAVSVLLVFGLNAVKMEYRRQLERRTSDQEGIVAKARWFADVVLESYLEPNPSMQVSTVVASAVNRVDHLALFAYVVETTPSMVEFWEGTTYQSFLTSFVPRVLWPDKPIASLGNEFGRRYHILHGSNYSTSVNLPWLPEFYVNFGDWGVVLGMTLVGAAFRFLVQKLANPRATLVEYVFGLTLIFQLFYAESNLALMWGGLFLSFLAFYTVLRLAGRRYAW
jgi:hypothetical protein